MKKATRAKQTRNKQNKTSLSLHRFLAKTHFIVISAIELIQVEGSDRHGGPEAQIDRVDSAVARNRNVVGHCIDSLAADPAPLGVSKR
jgi:hypothetical protein